MDLEFVREEDLVKVILCQTNGGGCLKGTLKKKHLQVSIKILSSRTLGQSEWSEWVRDVAVVRQVNSQRVLVPLGVYKAWCLTGLLYEWMPEGSLHSVLYQTQLYPNVPMSLRLGILCDVAEGLRHLHSIPLIHQALKPTNVLLDQQYRAKLSDWGLPWEWRIGSSFPSGGGPCLRDLVCLAPEVLPGTTPSVQADVYSFGVLLWETLNQRQPGVDLHRRLSTEDGVGLSLEGELLPPCVPHCHTLSQLMTGCCKTDPHSRPTADHCVLALRHAIATFDPDAVARATLRVKHSKERALHDSKTLPFKDIPIEINNIEPLGDTRDVKSVGKKTLPLPQLSSPIKTLPGPSKANYAGEESLNRHCEDIRSSCVSISSRPRCPNSDVGGVHYRGAGHNPTHPLSYSPHNALRQDLVKKPSDSSHAQVPVIGCRILRERRESIIRGMTEGRLNNVLDVLISRQAISLEAYEVISASLTLSARTRSLLDYCLCLGEHVAALVATTLGLIPSVNNPPQMSR
ncbi:hypothetical protein UPYG_G00081450 [Umbra pygmaea]|uniref:Receptor-interacting serine/threonine-protein kinase 2-like n=1 Tax=Umbra pygmaea TaxID=75934 RepID=A0ABD0XGJ5_UMBPY